MKSKKGNTIDYVNKPPHYNNHPKGFECIDVIEDLPHNLATAVKYIWRVGFGGKWDNEEDIDKAIWYLSRFKKQMHAKSTPRRRRNKT